MGSICQLMVKTENSKQKKRKTSNHIQHMGVVKFGRGLFYTQEKTLAPHPMTERKTLNKNNNIVHLHTHVSRTEKKKKS